MVLPLTAETISSGHLMIGGCDTVALAKKFGTPLFVMDEDHIRQQCRRYTEAFKNLNPQSEVIYAGKAFLSVAFLRIIVEEGLSLDVMSGGELFAALRAGVPADRIYFHGNNKSAAEIELALSADVGHFVVDSFNELDMLSRMAKSLDKKATIMLRLTPGVTTSTHEYVQTGIEDTKFGFSIAEGVAAEATEKALSLDNIELTGYHAHIGSQIFALQSYEKAIKILMSFMAEMQESLDFKACELDTGGGLGIRYKLTDEPSAIEDYARVVIDGVTKEAKKHGMKVPRVMIEPGRSIVGNAGVTLYTIGTIKSVADRVYVSVDGGMSDNIRPMLYRAVYEVIIANKASKKSEVMVTVAGKHCETGDILVDNVKIPKPDIGDILCMPATGAYGYVMANNYNRVPRPPVVMVKDGKARVIIRRETYEDLLRLEEY